MRYRAGLAFHRFVESMAGKDRCWFWRKSLDRDGYGRTKVNGKTTRASRVSWRIHRGKIPKGIFVLHSCDRPACINPDHLFLGTQIDNCRDAMAKDRHSRGTRNGISKLNNRAVRAIRKSKKTQWELARKYGVWQGTIWHVINRKRWAHVQD